MIDAAELKRLVEAWKTLKPKADESKSPLDRENALDARYDLERFLLSHASELLALVEAQTALRKFAESQEPLGAEFEAALGDRSTLYES